MALLDVLDSQMDAEVITQAGPALRTLIRNGREIIDLCMLLSNENRTLLFKQLGSALHTIIGSASNLAHLLALLADEDSENALLKGIGRKGLHSLINTPEDLALLFEWVYDSSDELLLELVGMAFVLERCKTGYEIGLILQSLNATSQKKFISAAGENAISQRIFTTRDLAYLLRAMTTDVSTGFLKRLPQDHIKRVVGNKEELKRYQNMIEAKEYGLLISKL
jgi:hypothetical protein